MHTNVLMIASGKGGTGKSTTAVLVGAALAQQGKKVLAVELDSGLRSVDLIAGISEQVVYDVADVLAKQCSMQKAICQSPLYEGLYLMAAPYSDTKLHTEYLENVVQQMAQQFDIVLLDVGAGMGQAFQAACNLCETALLVITPDPLSVRDGRTVCEWICSHSQAVPRLLINRVQPALLAKTNMPDLDECIDAVAAQLIGVVPESIEIRQALSKQSALTQKCAAWKAFENVAKRICGQDVPLLFR